jgi:hypothetical protein
MSAIGVRISVNLATKFDMDSGVNGRLASLQKVCSHIDCNNRLQASDTVFRRPGGFGGELEPDPIPNSAVNLPSADGTKS